ncbi:uncharacterized protein LOC124934726 [Impatiens glandulifera]|uniref:uncharacterized protein LOC124934726 n=1 Tax=Impatiens glandulifera TaxID=253017 RepID=UPI001FB09C4B|nr:uncharacterized protein LOC124934726 [Impatiens glandulifera]
MECQVCTTSGDLSFFSKGSGGGGGGGRLVSQIDGFSYESEHDLAAMVSDFLENGSSGTDSRHSSDNEVAFCDLTQLADSVLYYKHSADQYENDLLSIVNSLLLSIKDTDEDLLHLANKSKVLCKGSCIRFSLVKLLRISGYDAAVCASKWQAHGNVPGGDHVYIDVINHRENRNSERLIIDIDFRSHFEIARAVNSYEQILDSLPVIYVGSIGKLKHLLNVMVEAARSSLKQNTMPLPPWRSLAYLLAKWKSPHDRKFNPNGSHSVPSQHNLCREDLGRLQSLIQSNKWRK